jgi:hypothetical protein
LMTFPSSGTQLSAIIFGKHNWTFTSDVHFNNFRRWLDIVICQQFFGSRRITGWKNNGLELVSVRWIQAS